MTDTLIKYIFNGNYRFLINCSLGLHRKMPDEKYLMRVYRACIGKELDLQRPKTFNEKLQWLKLHDRNPAYHQMADKAEVKSYVAEKIGKEYIIPSLGVYNSFDEIDFEALPGQFVLKCTHDSGGLVICRDKSRFDKQRAKKTINHFLKRDYFSQWREWPYKDLPHRIIAEQYIDDSGNGLTDYKVHCFNGVPRLILVCQDRFAPTGLTEDFFTEDWKHLDVKRPEHPNASVIPKRPEELDDLLEYARVLAESIPFVRVDFYIVNHQILFSELTFFPASGLTPFEPEEWDLTFGKWLNTNMV